MATTAQEIAEEIDDREEEWLDILKQLISIPSEDPPGDTIEISNFIADFFEDKGVPFEVIAPKSSMPNVVAQFNNGPTQETKSKHLVFNGHLDTFLVNDEDSWEYGPFSGEVEDGRIYGRGAGDMHGGFTATLAAFTYLFEHRDMFDHKVTFAAVSHEESGGEWGTGHIVKNYPEYNGDVVLNGEPSSPGLICFAEKGHLWFKIRVQGEGGHSALPEGISATKVLYEISTISDEQDLSDMPVEVEEIFLDSKQATDKQRGDGFTEHLFNPSVNIGRIDGGDKINLVAREAEAVVDIRLPVGASVEDAVEHVNERLSNFSDRVNFEILSRSPPSYSDISLELFEDLQKYAGVVRGGEEPDFTGSSGFTDCRFYRQHGVPAVWYGPSVTRMGMADEHIYLDEFMDVTKAHTMASASYLGLVKEP
jgi:succinyl-diaminopimelate desuccinylase